ncbi:hypothetical protein C8R45DRAFT_446718 [Mycena sanguinolenta]|nr:hypothetical protein C8R45DRAFT_446718 [Mycena sanguinolenta]
MAVSFSRTSYLTTPARPRRRSTFSRHACPCMSSIEAPKSAQHDSKLYLLGPISIRACRQHNHHSVNCIRLVCVLPCLSFLFSFSPTILRQTSFLLSFQPRCHSRVLQYPAMFRSLSIPVLVLAYSFIRLRVPESPAAACRRINHSESPQITTYDTARRVGGRT